MLFPASSQLSDHGLSKKVDYVSKTYAAKTLKTRLAYQKALKISLSLILVGLSFSMSSCATLNALEPTAVLISDIKDIL